MTSALTIAAQPKNKAWHNQSVQEADQRLAADGANMEK